MSELKNCPFCGSPAVHIKNNVGVNYITCSNTYKQSKGDCVYDLRVNPKGWSRRPAEAEITALKQREAKLVEALKLYANEYNWSRLYERQGVIGRQVRNILHKDGGTKAREVLKELEIEL